MNSRTIRWLHLSDFHVGKDDYAQRRMFERIIENAEAKKGGGFMPDFLFITGDLANKGKAEEYGLFNKEFLEPLQKALGEGISSRTFAIPGNHDVDRTKNQAFDRSEIADPKAKYFDPTEDGKVLRQLLLPRFKSFAENGRTLPKDLWCSSPEGAFGHIEVVRGIKVGIVGINTAWLSKDDNDREKLTPGKPLLEHALGKLSDCAIRIVLGHHPLDWFLPTERKMIESLLGKSSALYLHGHLHNTWAAPGYGGGHHFLAVQSGACFQAREGEIWRNGLIWGRVCLVRNVLTLQPWEWNADHQDWTLVADAFPNVCRRAKSDVWEWPLPGDKKKSEPLTPAEASSTTEAQSLTVSDHSIFKVVIPPPPLPRSGFNVPSLFLQAVELAGAAERMGALMMSQPVQQAIQTAAVIDPSVFSSPTLVSLHPLSLSDYSGAVGRTVTLDVPVGLGHKLVVQKFEQVELRCKVIPFSKLLPSQEFAGEGLSLSPLKSLSEVERYFVELDKVKTLLAQGKLAPDRSFVLVDVHGSGKTSLLAYLCRKATERGFEPLWVFPPDALVEVDVEREVERALALYKPKKPLIVIDAAERCPNVLKSIAAMRSSGRSAVPVWVSLASEDTGGSPHVDTARLFPDVEHFPLPGILCQADIERFIERIKSETTLSVCDLLRHWGQGASPGLMLAAYLAILESGSTGRPEVEARRRITSIAHEPGQQYEDLFNVGLTQHMREIITYVAVLEEVEIGLLQAMARKAGLDPALVDTLVTQKRRLFVRETDSHFQTARLRVAYLHDGLRLVALRPGNFDERKAHEIIELLTRLASDPDHGGTACLKLLQMIRDPKTGPALLTEDRRRCLQLAFAAERIDARRYWVAANLAEVMPSLLDLADGALKDAGTLPVWSRILDAFGVQLGSLRSDHKRAAAFFTQAMEIDPKHAEARAHAAQAHYFLGDKARALTTLEQAPEEVKSTGGYRLAWGGLLIGFGYEAQARPVLEHLVHDEPENVAALVNLSSLASRRKNYARAKNLLLRAVKASPGNAELVGRLVGVELASRLVTKPPEAKTEQGRMMLDAAARLLIELPENAVLLRVRADMLAHLGEDGEAQAVYERLLQRNPTDAAVLVNLSSLAGRRKDYARARGLLLRAVKASPENVGLVWRLVGVELASRWGTKPPEAKAEQGRMVLDAAARLLIELPENAALLRVRADVLAELGQDDEAQAVYEQLLQRSPSDAAVLANLSALAGRRKDYAHARELLLRAVTASPENVGLVWRLVGVELANRGVTKPPVAKAEQSKMVVDAAACLLKELPENAALLRVRADGLAKLGQDSEAQAVYEQLLQRDPSDAAVLVNLSSLAGRRKDYASAKELLLRAVKVAPENVELVSRLVGVEMESRGVTKPPEANAEQGRMVLDVADSLLEELSENANLLRFRADALTDLGQDGEAQAVYERLLQRNPGDAEVLANLSSLAGRRKDYARAKELLLRAVKASPNNVELAGRLVGADLASHGSAQPPDAEAEREKMVVDAADRLLKELPENAGLLRVRGDALAKLGRADEAQAVYEQLLQRNPSDAPVLANSASLASRRKDYARAKELLLRAVRASPKNEELVRRLVEAELASRGVIKLPEAEVEQNQVKLDVMVCLLKELPGNADLLRDRAYALAKLGRAGEVLAALDGVPAEEWTKDMRVTAAWCCFRLKDIDKMSRHFNAVHSALNSESPPAAVREAAEIALGCGNPEKALAILASFPQTDGNQRWTAIAALISAGAHAVLQANAALKLDLTELRRQQEFCGQWGWTELELVAKAMPEGPAQTAFRIGIRFYAKEVGAEELTTAVAAL